MPTPNSKKLNVVPLVVGLIILAVAGWYGFSKFGDLSSVKAQLAEADEILVTLEQNGTRAQSAYQKANKEYVESFSSNEEKIDVVFPAEEDITALTRIFDDFAFENHYTSNPFFVSNLSYGSLNTNNTDYDVLPITMTIQASEKNFEKFLEFVATSGSLDNGIRLMDIDAISLSFSDSEETFQVQLSLNAYLQKA